jgi:hypothetical protein
MYKLISFDSTAISYQTLMFLMTPKYKRGYAKTRITGINRTREDSIGLTLIHLFQDLRLSNYQSSPLNRILLDKYCHVYGVACDK